MLDFTLRPGPVYHDLLTTGIIAGIRAALLRLTTAVTVLLSTW
jgi:hypothetical protein